MILAQAHPHEARMNSLSDCCRQRPQAWPNSRMITFADELLDRHGRLSAATAGIYTRQLEKRPELAEIMRRGNRAREVELGLSGKQPGPLQRAV